MIKIVVRRQSAWCVKSPDEHITTGLTGKMISFDFGPDWDGYVKTAIFEGSGESIPRLLTGDRTTIPAGCLTKIGSILRVGVYGTDGKVQTPTIYTVIDQIDEGADAYPTAEEDPALPIWAQLQAMIGDLGNLTTEAKENLVAAINEAAKTGSSSGGGSMSMQVKDGYIQYSADEGKTWNKLITLAELTGPAGPVGGKGDQGEQGPQGIPGPAYELTEADKQEIVEDVLAEMPDIPSGGGNADLSYKWVSRGYMRDQVREFQGWAHCIRYDPELGKAVGIVISGEGSHSNTAPYYRVEIDPATGYMSEYEEVTVNYPTGEANTDCGYVGSFVILPNGTYWMCDYYKRIFTSGDKGYTWDFANRITLGRNTTNNDFLFGAIRLSNGYMVAGNGGNSARESYYSTDNGATWNVVAMNSNLGSQTYPESGFTPFEPFFVECGNGKVIQYARASMNAYLTGSAGARTKKEAAAYSISNDYGKTWSPWEWSSALTDMTACNGRAVVIGDKVHAVYGSRYKAEDNEFHLFYATTNRTDILNDEWESPIIIDVGHWDAETATWAGDCGYPSLFADKNNNLFAVYYDGDGTGSASGANWRLCVGTPAAAQISPIHSGSGSYNVGYSQSAVDALLLAQKQFFMEQIAAVYAAIGQLPPVTDLDGSMYVTDGLVASWDFWDIASWEDKLLKSKVSDHYAYASAVPTLSESGNWLSSNTVDIGFNTQKASLQYSALLKDFGVNGDFTIEDVQYSDSNLPFHLDINQINGKWIQPQIRYNHVPVPADDGTSVSTQHVGDDIPATGTVVGHLVLSGNTISCYKNGKFLGSLELTDTQKNWLYSCGFRHRGMNQGYRCLTRYYAKALSAEEINNNVTYDLGVCKAKA